MAQPTWRLGLISGKVTGVAAPCTPAGAGEATNVGRRGTAVEDGVGIATGDAVGAVIGVIIFGAAADAREAGAVVDA